MIAEMTAAELDANCRTYVALQSGEMNRTKMLLGCKYARVEEDEAGYMRVYDLTTPEEIVSYLYENGICVTEVGIDKIGLEEYYIDLMNGGKK
jgi:ABC-2 type transport system ATP-binding protein